MTNDLTRAEADLETADLTNLSNLELEHADVGGEGLRFNEDERSSSWTTKVSIKHGGGPTTSGPTKGGGTILGKLESS